MSLQSIPGSKRRHHGQDVSPSRDTHSCGWRGGIWSTLRNAKVVERTGSAASRCPAETCRKASMACCPPSPAAPPAVSTAAGWSRSSWTPPHCPANAPQQHHQSPVFFKGWPCQFLNVQFFDRPQQHMKYKWGIMTTAKDFTLNSTYGLIC